MVGSIIGYVLNAVLTSLEVAGCECFARHHGLPMNRLQVFDVKVQHSTAECTLQISASAELLITAVYMVLGTLENNNTTLQHPQ
jgi:uncharacterized OsmC-like protein